LAIHPSCSIPVDRSLDKSRFGRGCSQLLLWSETAPGMSDMTARRGEDSGNRTSRSIRPRCPVQLAPFRRYLL